MISASNRSDTLPDEVRLKPDASCRKTARDVQEEGTEKSVFSVPSMRTRRFAGSSAQGYFSLVRCASKKSKIWLMIAGCAHASV